MIATCGSRYKDPSKMPFYVSNFALGMVEYKKGVAIFSCLSDLTIHLL